MNSRGREKYHGKKGRNSRIKGKPPIASTARKGGWLQKEEGSGGGKGKRISAWFIKDKWGKSEGKFSAGRKTKTGIRRNSGKTANSELENVSGKRVVPGKEKNPSKTNYGENEKRKTQKQTTASE